MFPVPVLYQLGELFSFSSVPRGSHTLANLRDLKLKDKLLRTYIWLCCLINASSDVCKIVIENYRITRGSANPNVFSRKTSSKNEHGATLNLPKQIQPKNLISHTPPALPKNIASYTPGGSPHVASKVQELSTEVNQHSSSNASLGIFAGANPPGYPVTISGSNQVSGNNTFQSSHSSQTAANHPDNFLALGMDKTRKPNYVQHMVKDIRFSGAISQDIGESLRKYSIFSKQYKLSRAQQADFFVHFFWICSSLLSG